MSDAAAPGSIAIVGMSGRFPGAPDLGAFWRNLRDGLESITALSEQDLATAGVAPELLADPQFVRASPVLEHEDRFDAAFFDFTPREAATTDPQQRVFLECAWAAIEDSGHTPATFDGAIGVYAGVGANTYLLFNLLPNPEVLRALGGFQLMIGNDKDYLATRTAYKLNLRGPSMSVQTACSTGLVAVALACQSLLDYQCDMALAGGVSIRVPQRAGYRYQPGDILSPDGHCRSFDAQAQGTIFGSGAGVVVLRRLADALADGDQIYAVVKGWAVNNDGALKIGYTAPSVDGQVRVIAEALAVAEADPATIGYVETHGTATPLGDPIEIAALTKAFGPLPAGSCAIGSVKTNVGHLDTAAGMAGLIKTVLALRHGQIPPSLHFSQPNPQIDFAHSPFYVNTRLADWPARAVRRAGVSSFGIGGTNAHLIVEQAPAPKAAAPAQPWQLLVLSAKTATALDQASANLADFLRDNPGADLADVAYTLQAGRAAFAYRRALVGRDQADALAALAARDPQRVFAAEPAPERALVTFLFPGGGAQYVQMGRELYAGEPVFREQIDRCAELLRPHLGLDLRAVLYPPAIDNSAPLTRTATALPALFAFEYALARLWMAWGIQPQALIGHSLGEYVAACLAGVLTLDDALALVALRGRLFERLPAGAMLSVALPEAAIRPLLGGQLGIAAINGPARCVVTGPAAAIEELAGALTAQAVEFRRLPIDVAAHSELVEPILAEFRAFVSRLRLRPPQIACVSNLTGGWLTPEDATDPEYWVRHLRQTVRFADGLRALLEEPDRVLLEVGPGQALAGLARRSPARAGQVVLASLPREHADERAGMLATLGQLWLAGAAPDWAALHAGTQRRRVSLPAYPFERERFWIDPPAPGAALPAATPERKPDLADWFAVPSWRRALPPEPIAPDPRGWLIFADAGGLGQQLARRLTQAGRACVVARQGKSFGRIDAQTYTLDLREPAQYHALIGELRAAGGLPGTIVHMCSLAASPADALERGFYSLLWLAQALGERPAEAPLRLVVVSSHLHEVTGDERLIPEQAALLGPCQAIGLEYQQIACWSVDVELFEPGDHRRERLLDQLLAELAGRSADQLVAYRGAHRWVQAFEPLRLSPAPNPIGRLRERGVYLITGGLGAIGLALAAELAASVRARLALLGRTRLPARETWDAWLAEHPEPDTTSRALRALLSLEQQGGELLTLSADVADPAQLRAAVAATEAHFGPINGVIHAAGVPGGGMIQLKTRAAAEAVLAPKLAGLRALEAALAGTQLDFLLLCASTIGVAGGFGQADYAGANAFLDAFAHDYARRGVFAVSIDWGAWREAGMAVDTAGLRARHAAPQPLAARPLIETCLSRAPERAVYQLDLRPDQQWLLAEHTVAGVPTLPGTAFLELARAAFEQFAGPGPIELHDVVFLAPLMVAPGERPAAQIILERAGPGCDFRVVSQAGGHSQEHARGSIRPIDTAQPPRADLAALIATLAPADRWPAAGADPAAFVDWGPRWQSLREVYAGADTGLARLELPAAFEADLAQFPLHPALLDVATAFGHQAAGAGLYLPLMYASVAVRRPLVGRIYSLARYRPGGAADTLTFDVRLLDEQGDELVGISGFSLKRVDPAALARPAALAEGISREQGVEAFRRILAGCPAPQVVVSPTSVPALIARARALTQSSILGELEQSRRGMPAHPRPRMHNAYVAPSNPIEQTIATIWQAVFGLEQVGVHDNFYELGGDSLLAAQAVFRLREAFELDLPLRSLFETPTIAGLAPTIELALLAAASPDDLAQALDELELSDG